MSTIPYHDSGSQELTPADRIDLICDEFEREWLSGQPPQIESYLQDATEPERSSLLIELIKVDWEYRLRHGETPRLADYRSRFPDYTERIVESGIATEEIAETVIYTSSEAIEFAHFELRQSAGLGSFGEVWKAYDRKLQRIVALKLPRGGRNAVGADTFLREARAAARLRHPHIVQIHDAAEHEGTVYIVSEFVDGIDLRSWIKSRSSPVPVRVAATLCATIGDALHHAHQHGIIHRDLKPANILLDQSGQPHVTDFGMAKRSTTETTVTAEGQRMGTIPYMSPEQAGGNSHRADSRSDVFSIGVILYELLAGERPFRGEDHIVLHQILTEDPPPLRSRRRDVPPDLETVCLKALAKHPDARYASAKDFADDLRRFLASEPIRARRAGHWNRAWRWYRRNWLSASLAGALCVAFLLLAAWLPSASSSLSPDSADASQKVQLDTIPRGAAVVFVPLDPITGRPQPEKMVRPNQTSPVQTNLVPGDYLVVVDLPSYGFHEVYRHVPGEKDGLSNVWLHREWKWVGDVVKLPTVRIYPSAMIDEGMVFLEGTDRFQIPSGPRSVLPPYLCRMPSFHIDSGEVTVGAWNRFCQAYNAQLPGPTKEDLPEDHAVVNVSYDQAIFYAEFQGKRLPTQEEATYAATNQGASKYPWGDSIGMLSIPERKHGPVGEPDFDITASVPPIHGLCSNVAEWTSTWFAPNPGVERTGVRPSNYDAARAREMRVAVGGGYSVIEGQPTQTDWAMMPNATTAWHRDRGMPGLGFRCVRSAKPRLRPEDYQTIIQH